MPSKVLPRPPCQAPGCDGPARSIVAYRVAKPMGTEVYASLICDKSDHLLWARELAATHDQDASIIRIGNPASLFHSNQGQADHLPPYICAACRRERHSECDNQVGIRRAGAVVVVGCDCYSTRHDKEK